MKTTVRQTGLLFEVLLAWDCIQQLCGWREYWVFPKWSFLDSVHKNKKSIDLWYKWHLGQIWCSCKNEYQKVPSAMKPDYLCQGNAIHINKVVAKYSCCVLNQQIPIQKHHFLHQHRVFARAFTPRTEEKWQVMILFIQYEMPIQPSLPHPLPLLAHRMFHFHQW